MNLRITVGIGLACLVNWGCSNDLSRQDAASALESHLRAHAPLSFQGWVDSGTTHLIAVEAILQPTETTREVRWRQMFVYDDSVGNPVSDTSDLLTANFTKGDREWLISSYGPGMIDRMTFLIYREQWRHYLDLRHVLEDVNKAVKVWSDSLRARKSWYLKNFKFSNNYWDSYLRLVEKEEEGPTLDELVVIIDSLGVSPPSGIALGVEQASLPELRYPVLWVGLKDSSEVQCAKAIGYAGDRMPARGFYWMESAYGSCRGRSIGATEETETIMERIREMGNFAAP